MWFNCTAQLNRYPGSYPEKGKTWEVTDGVMAPNIAEARKIWQRMLRDILDPYEKKGFKCRIDWLRCENPRETMGEF